MIDTKELRGKLFELYAQYESKYGIQTVKDKDIGYEDGGLKVLKAYMKIRDEFLDNVMKLFDSELDRLYAHEKETTPFASCSELEKALEGAGLKCTVRREQSQTPYTHIFHQGNTHFHQQYQDKLWNVWIFEDDDGNRIEVDKHGHDIFYCTPFHAVTPALLKALGVVK